MVRGPGRDGPANRRAHRDLRQAPAGPRQSRRPCSVPFALSTPTGERVRPMVVGVIKDIRHHGLDRPASGGIYVLWSQLPAGISYLAVRSSGSLDAMAPSLLRLLHELDPLLPLPEARTIEQEMHRSILGREIRVMLVGAFAALAAVLALTGLSGALGRSVRERRRGIAVRAALGASPTSTVRLVLRDGSCCRRSVWWSGLAWRRHSGAARRHCSTASAPTTSSRRRCRAWRRAARTGGRLVAGSARGAGQPHRAATVRHVGSAQTSRRPNGFVIARWC